MRQPARRGRCHLLAACCMLGAGLACAAEPLLAGLDPARRPPLAPQLKTFTPPPAWHAAARQGLGTPATGLGFLADQGAWYTPFAQPGMSGPYDWRQLHRQRPAGDAR